MMDLSIIVNYVSEIIKVIIGYINSISGGNQMIGGAISLGIMGFVTYLIHFIPAKVYNFFIKHTTTELTTTSQNKVFHDLLKWMHQKGFSHKFRKIKLTNGRWGGDESFTKSVGYGSHIIWYNWQPILVSLNKEQSNNSEYDKETISLSKFGRSHKLFDDLIKQISKKLDNEESTSIYRIRKGMTDWDFILDQPKRPLDSIIIEEEKIDKITTTINTFLQKEQWYIDNGIPWQLGILLYGPPGTGKTSLIKALAAYTNKSLSLVSATYADQISYALQTVPKDTITVIEDVDSCSDVHKRIDDEDVDGEFLDKRMERMLERYGNVGLASLLNAVDGAMSTHGRILVMTTNHPEKIDKALLRPGRIDLKVEIGYITPTTFKIFVQRFFPDYDINKLSNFELKDSTLTGADLQSDVLENLTIEEIIKKRVK